MTPHAPGARVSILIATLALSTLAVSLALVGRLDGDRPSQVATLLIGASALNVSCAAVSITGRATGRAFGWWLCSTLLLGGLTIYTSLGEALSAWALLVFIVAIVATGVAVVRRARTASAE